jgi:hypothetical protein
MKSKGGAVMSKHKEISQPLQPSKINSNNSKISRKGKNPTRHRNATKSKAFVNSTTTRSALSLGKRKRSGDDDDECDQGLLHASKVVCRCAWLMMTSLRSNLIHRIYCSSLL